MKAWVIRSGGIAEPDVSRLFEAMEVAAVGWGDLIPDLSGMSKEKIRRMVTARVERAPSYVAGVFNRFVNEIEVGDLIVTPPTANRGPVLIGYCAGPYKYRPGMIVASDNDAYPHVRDVTWVDKVPRSELSDAFRASLLAHSTVFNVNKHIEEIQR